jgi:hypothetical protein
MNDLTTWLRPAMHVHIGILLVSIFQTEAYDAKISHRPPSYVEYNSNSQRKRSSYSYVHSSLLSLTSTALKAPSPPFPELSQETRCLLANTTQQGRVRIINVWRPLISSILDYPLSICSGASNSVSPSSLVETDHIRRHYMGSTMYLQHAPSLQFFYMSRQGMDDVLVFKNFDSDEEVGATCKLLLLLRVFSCWRDVGMRKSC